MTWFAFLAGLVEGAGLLFFQRINWRDWGPMMHVAKQIIWISPLFDWVFFLVVALLIVLLVGGLIVRVFPRVDAIVWIISGLTFLTAYDWLSLTARLSHWSCFLLALGISAACTRWFERHRESFVTLCKRSAPWLVAIWILVFVGIEGGMRIAERMETAKLPAAAPGSPNILVIVVDTLRADHVSAYGYARPTTPEIDRLAQQGVLFENAIAPSSWSLPSHASLLTGRYAFEHGMQNIEPMPWLGWRKSSLRGLPTLGEELQKRGYRTGAFSANRVYFTSNVGLGRGFIHFEDYFYSVADSFVRTLYGREFARIYLSRSDKSLVRRSLRRIGFTSLLDRDTEGWEPNGGARGVRKRAQEVNDETLHWVDHGPDSGRPFFAFLNYMDVHDPYGIPFGYPKPAWDTGSTIDRYDDGVSYTDHYIGQLITSLEQRGLARNTAVVITSDHGEELGEHGLHFHAQALYWELIHVPLVIWYPGHIPTGLRFSLPVTDSAIPATILDLLGAKPGENVFRGPALSELWKNPSAPGQIPRPAGENAGQRNDVIRSEARPDWPTPVAELAQNHINPEKAFVPNASEGAMQTLVTPDFQLILHQKFGYQLYDWKHDPGESHNLTSTAAGSANALSLGSELKSDVHGSMP